MLLRRNFSSFPQYFQYISNLGVKLHIHSVKGSCSINCFPKFRKADMSKYGYLEVFLRLDFEIMRVDCTKTKLPEHSITYKITFALSVV